MMEIGGLLRHSDRWFSCRSRSNRSIIAKRVLKNKHYRKKKREEKKEKLTIRMWVTYSPSGFDQTNSSSSSHALS
jgi:hypothetical protein